MAGLIEARALVAGEAQGNALYTCEPLSFWGGFEAQTGEIIDRRHELSGQVATGRVLVLPYGRGSSTASGILLEAIRLGTAPAAVILAQTDPILALGAIVARELYDRVMPLLVVGPDDFERLREAQHIQIEEDGQVHWT